MTDELPPQQSSPIEATPVPQENKPTPENVEVNKRGHFKVLGKLPPDIKMEMDLYLIDNGPSATRQYMINKYGEKYPDLAKLKKIAWKGYYIRNKESIGKTAALQKLSLTPPPEIMGVIDAITNPEISLADKKNALTALFNSCQARSVMLEQKNSIYVDSQFEALILQNRKEQHAILKTVATLNDQLSKDAEKDWLEEASILTQVIFDSVINTYRVVNQDKNLSLFISSLEENVKNALSQYKLARERISKDGTL